MIQMQKPSQNNNLYKTRSRKSKVETKGIFSSLSNLVSNTFGGGPNRNECDNYNQMPQSQSSVSKEKKVTRGSLNNRQKEKTSSYQPQLLKNTRKSTGRQESECLNKMEMDDSDEEGNNDCC